MRIRRKARSRAGAGNYRASSGNQPCLCGPRASGVRLRPGRRCLAPGKHLRDAACVSPRNGLLLGLALAALTWALFEQGRLTLKAHPDDPSLIGLFFLGAILLSVVTGIVFVVAFLPALGELIGNFFFQPNEKPGPSPHAQAQEALAQGDPETALRCFRAAVLDHRQDRIATSEIARLLCEHRGEPIAGRDFLENALRRSWPPDDYAFLILRLAEIYAFHLGDLPRATELWQRTVMVYPATEHADEARARLAALDSGES